MNRETVEQLIEKLKKLHLEEAELLSKLTEAIARQNTDANRENKNQQFKVGDRVLILNKIGIRLGRSDDANDRRAFITTVTKERIYVRTVNRNWTWRHPKNLRRVPDSEEWSS
jgi:hypothetical protein